jgi:hypothetical protein
MRTTSGQRQQLPRKMLLGTGQKAELIQLPMLHRREQLLKSPKIPRRAEKPRLRKLPNGRYCRAVPFRAHRKTKQTLVSNRKQPGRSFRKETPDCSSIGAISS